MKEMVLRAALAGRELVGESLIVELDMHEKRAPSKIAP